MRIVFDESASDLENDTSFSEIASMLERCNFFPSITVFRGPGIYFLGEGAKCGAVIWEKPLSKINSNDIEILRKILEVSSSTA